MKENAISKINKLGQIGGYITLAVKIIVIIGLVFSIAVTVVCTMLPKNFLQVKMSGNALVNVDWSTLGKAISQDDVIQAQEQLDLQKEENNSSFDVNGIDYRMNGVKISEKGIKIDTTADENTFDFHSCALALGMAVVKMGLTLVTLFFIGFLCKEFRNCQTPFETGVIKKMQNLAISLIPWTIFSSVANSFAQSVFTGKVEIVSAIDLNVVFIILLLLALTYVFKYGAVLQQESDETL